MTIKFNNQVNLTDSIGTRTNRNCKQVICIETGEIYNSATDAAEKLGCSVDNVSSCCRGKSRLCKGKHLSYISHTSENVNALASHIRKISSNHSELEQKAALWDAYQAEQEAIRKANETHELALAKAKAKVERRKRVVDNLDDKFQAAVSRLLEAERELEALENAK